MATTFTHKVSDGRQSVTVDFTLHPIRSSNFLVLVQDGQGKFNTHVPAAASTYLGRVQGMRGALASGLVRANGNVLCRISFENGVEWSSTGVGKATVRGRSDWKPKPATKSSATVASGGAGSQVFAAEVGVDCTHAHYVAAGSSVAATLEMVEFSVMAANVPYLRDAAILHRLGKVVVRTSNAADPYVADGTKLSALLRRVKEQWNNVLPVHVGRTHQLALVVRPGAPGGLAFIETIGTVNRYSANGGDGNGDFSVIWRHEAGHNWGSHHYEGGRAGHVPEGPTILSDNSLSRFSSAELVKILAHRATKTSILHNLGPYSFALPPRANMDHHTFHTDVPTTLNVLANDSDSNGQAISLSYVPPSSALGGTLAQSGQRIIYTPPTHMASGVDYFSYQIQDATHSGTGTGYVTLRPVLDDDLVAHWPLDEGKGKVAYDTTSSQNDGKISGGAVWVSGHTREAISLNGTTGQVITGGLNLTTNSITITGWVRCNGKQADWAGLAMCRNSQTTAGLNLATSNELRYHWCSGNNPSFHFKSGLTLPDAIWTFVALVISPTQATIYMRQSGMTLNSASTNGTFNPQSFQGSFCLGNDQLVSSNRHFKGDIADFRVFRRALRSSEITLNSASTNGTFNPQSFQDDMGDFCVFRHASLANNGGARSARTEIASLANDGGTRSARTRLMQPTFGSSPDFDSTPTIEEEPILCESCEIQYSIQESSP